MVTLRLLTGTPECDDENSHFSKKITMGATLESEFS